MQKLQTAGYPEEQKAVYPEQAGQSIYLALGMLSIISNNLDAYVPRWMQQ